MTRRSKLTDEERIGAVQEYLDGKGSYGSIAKKYGIALQTLRQKVIYAKTNGIESIRISHRNKRYSAETKVKAVTEYLKDKESQIEICQRYHIPDTRVFRRWILFYYVQNLSAHSFTCFSELATFPPFIEIASSALTSEFDASSFTRFKVLAPSELPLCEKNGIIVFPLRSYSSKNVHTCIGKSYHQTGNPKNIVSYFAIISLSICLASSGRVPLSSSDFALSVRTVHPTNL